MAVYHANQTVPCLSKMDSVKSYHNINHLFCQLIVLSNVLWLYEVYNFRMMKHVFKGIHPLGVAISELCKQEERAREKKEAVEVFTLLVDHTGW